MEIIDKATDKIKAWLWSIAIKKGLKRGARLLAAWLAVRGAAELGYTGGEAEILTGFYLAIGWAKGLIKTKWPKVGAWL